MQKVAYGAFCPREKDATFTRSSIAAAQAPEQPAVVLVRALVRPASHSGSKLHSGRELGAARLARRRFVITSHRLAGRPSSQRYGSDRAFELNRTANEC